MKNREPTETAIEKILNGLKTVLKGPKPVKPQFKLQLKPQFKPQFKLQFVKKKHVHLNSYSYFKLI